MKILLLNNIEYGILKSFSSIHFKTGTTTATSSYSAGSQKSIIRNGTVTSSTRTGSIKWNQWQ